MKKTVAIPHAECVNRSAITGRFSSDRRHRYSLLIPLRDRDAGRVLRIVGQNPSAANEDIADKTIRYLELFVFKNYPEYGTIEMVNLYTRMDKDKVEKDVLDNFSDQEFKRSISAGSDVLVVFGQLRNEKAYRFKDRALELRPTLELANLYKINIGTEYAPHPGNPAIVYSKLDLRIEKFTLAQSSAK